LSGAIIQFLAFALPVIAIFFAIVLDIYSAVENKTPGFTGSLGAIIARAILMLNWQIGDRRIFHSTGNGRSWLSPFDTNRSNSSPQGRRK
jgi:chromate transport protein ChrA